MTKPTLLDVYSSEGAMCRAFWKIIMTYQMHGKMKPHSIFHVPNGQDAGSSDKSRIIAGQKDKYMGVVAGVADYCVVGVGFLEAKKYVNKNGKISKTHQSPVQKEFEANVKDIGQKYEIFRTPEVKQKVRE